MFKRRERQPRSMKTLISREMRISRRHIYVGTQYLTPVKEKDFHAFLVADRTEKAKWIENVQECDNFALYLISGAKKWFVSKYNINAAVGMVWRGGVSGQRGHALNFIVNEQFKIRYYEPQSDKEVFPVGKKLFVLI